MVEGWVWSPEKAALNKAKHGVSFEIAVRVFDDRLARSRVDLHPDGDRVQTMGRVGTSLLLLVVHTDVEEWRGQLVGRIISARRATRNERRVYEAGDF